MQLSKRLHAVASLVTPGNKVADIGCDHAYTSIYLVEQKISPKVIAMDVNQGPVDRAKENVMKYGFAESIEVRKSDGLQKLILGEADTILIAGMGGLLAIQILTEYPELLSSVRELVLQPQSDIPKVRNKLTELGFLITEENMIKEDGKYYVMMKAEPETLVEGRENYQLQRVEQVSFGRLLLEQKHPILLEFLLWDRGINEGILQNLNTEQTESSLLRKKEIGDKIDLINCGIEYFT